MVRRTSAEAFKAVMEDGTVSRRRREVYAALFKYGPCTGSELFRSMDWGRNVTHSNICTRLGELREMGVVEELGTRPCRVTGKRVILWDVTDRLPKKLIKKQRPSYGEAADLLSAIHCTVSAAFMGHDLAKRLDSFVKRAGR